MGLLDHNLTELLSAEDVTNVKAQEGSKSHTANQKNQGHFNACLEVLDSLETTLNSSGLIGTSPILTFAYPARPEIVLA